MFGLFGKKDKKPTGNKATGGKSREQLIAEATANARRAREELGEETIQKMAAALRRLEGNATPEDMDRLSAGERAKQEIMQMDKDHVADNLRMMLDDDRC